MRRMELAASESNIQVPLRWFTVARKLEENFET